MPADLLTRCHNETCLPDTMLLQDSWVIHECLGGVSNVALAVFDGHGQEGERVSRFVAATLPGLLAKSSAFKARAAFALAVHHAAVLSIITICCAVLLLHPRLMSSCVSLPRQHLLFLYGSFCKSV